MSNNQHQFSITIWMTQLELRWGSYKRCHLRRFLALVHSLWQGTIPHSSSLILQNMVQDLVLVFEIPVKIMELWYVCTIGIGKDCWIGTAPIWYGTVPYCIVSAPVPTFVKLKRKSLSQSYIIRSELDPNLAQTGWTRRNAPIWYCTIPYQSSQVFLHSPRFWTISRAEPYRLLASMVRYAPNWVIRDGSKNPGH